MSLLIGFLTLVLVVNCLFLMLLILIQLPKKEAGAGVAFGGAATDALFGAGSGNALTKMTKYSASVFVGLAVLLSILNMHSASAGRRRLQQELNRAGATTPILPLTPANPVVQATPSTTSNPAPAVANPVAPNTLMTTTLTNAATVPAPATPAPATPAAPSPTPEAPAK